MSTSIEITTSTQLGCLSTISGLALIGQSSALDKPNLSVEGYASALAEHPAGVYFAEHRPDWFRDCRAVDALDVLHTTNGGTIELLHMP
ncbi:hypothetical protein Tco_0729151, partial [Tanacetum coccineum]